MTTSGSRSAGWLFWVALLCVSVLSCSEDRPPHILLISIDSQRADMLSCYGYESATGRPTSPTLDTLAAEGVLFEAAYSTTSWTMPAHHALMSGLPDILHGALDDFHTASPDRTVLAESLAAAGYLTAGFYSGPYLHPAYGFGVGFGESYQNASLLPMPMGVAPEQRDLATMSERFHHTSTAEEVSYSARRAIDRMAEQDQPFFLFLHYFDVHYDYAPPAERYAQRFWPGGRRPRLNGDGFMIHPEIVPGMNADDLRGVISYYNGETLWVDEQIGAVLRALDDHGLREETIVIVTADHGDEFFEHGEKGHRNNLYEETLHVPLILRWPGHLPAGRRVQSRVSLVDVAPTIFDLAGVEAQSKVRFEGLPDGMLGRSLTACIEGSETEDREALGFLYNTLDLSRPTNFWALWTGPFKVIARCVFEPDSGRQRIQETTLEVYDLGADPGETRNLAEAGSPGVRAAVARFNELYVDTLFPLTEGFRAGGIPAFDAAEKAQHRRMLEDLGYVEPDQVSEQPPPPRLRLP